MNKGGFIEVRRRIDTIVGFVVEQPKTAETDADGSLLSRSYCNAGKTTEKDKTGCRGSEICGSHFCWNRDSCSVLCSSLECSEVDAWDGIRGLKNEQMICFVVLSEKETTKMRVE